MPRRCNVLGAGARLEFEDKASTAAGGRELGRSLSACYRGTFGGNPRATRAATAWRTSVDGSGTANAKGVTTLNNGGTIAEVWCSRIANA
jgi:hypothetical protein